MAYGKRGKRYGKRGGKRGGRRARAARRTDGGKVTMLRTPTVPDRLIMRMKYVDNIVLSGVAGASRVIRLNSIFDPDTSIVQGHQPLGFDQWSVFYTKYRVFGAKVTARFTNSSSNQADSEQVAILPFNAQNTPVLDDAFFEQPHVKKALLSGRGGMDRATLYCNANIPRILGMANVVYKSNPETASLFQTNPVEAVNLILVTRPIDGQSTSLVSVELQIEYYCEFFDRVRTVISYPNGKDPNAVESDGRIEDQ